MFKLTDNVKTWLMRGALVAACAAAVWQNHQMLEIKNQKLEKQEQKITKLEGEKKDLKQEIATKEQSQVITDTVTTTVRQAEVKVEKTKTEANLYVDKKLAEINTKYSQMEATPINQERQRTEISLERAKGLWLTYCLQEPAEQACK